MNDRRVKRLFFGAALALAAGTALIVGIFSHFGENMENIMARELTAQQAIIARNVKKHIEYRFLAVESFLKSLHHDTELNGILSPSEGRGEEERGNILSVFFESHIFPFLETADVYLRFAVTDGRGKMPIYAENLHGEIKPVYDMEGLEGRTPDFSLPSGAPSPEKVHVAMPGTATLLFMDGGEAPSMLDISLPVGGRGGEEWRLVVSLDLGAINILLAGDERGEHTYRWIFDDSGNLVCCSSAGTGEERREEIAKVLKSMPDTFEIMSDGDGNKMLSAIPLAIGDNRWSMVFESDFSEAVELVRGLNRMRTATVILFLLAMGGGTFYLYRYMVLSVVAEKEKLLLEQMAESERKFRLLFELSSEPIFVLSPDRIITDANSGAAKMIRMNKVKLLGSPLEKFMPESADFVNKMEKLAKEGGSISWEHSFTGGHGEILYFANTTAVLKTADGSVGSYHVYLHDVTERKKFELKLHREIENLDMIVSSIGGGLAVYNDDLSLSWCNAQYRDFWIKSHPADAARDSCVIGGDDEWLSVAKRTVASGVPFRGERRFSTNGMDSVCYLTTATPVKNSEGKTIRVIELMVDITDYKVMEKQLLHSEKLASIGELAAGIAHELNNPMTGIVGYSELLLEEVRDVDARADLRRINREAKRCSKIISNILTFARQHKPQRNHVEINSTIDATLEMVEYEYRSHSVLVEKDYEKRLELITGDFFELQQVFLNILNNAFYYLKTRPDPRNIWITTRNEKGGVAITIENNGPRIRDNVLERIFDPFFTTKEVGKGTGLGLSISHGIIKSHNGEITAQNTKRGVAFTIRIPQKTEEN